MPNTNLLIAHLQQELRKDPRPTCPPCLGILSPEDWALVHAQLSSLYRPLYTVETGRCWKCKTEHHQTVQPRHLT